jgi:WD40 repeat protein
VKGEWESQDWTQPGERGRQVPLAALPGQSLNYVTVGAGRKKESELQIVARSPQSSPQTRLEGHKARPVAAAVAADGKRIVSADEGGTLVVWEGEKFAFEEKQRVELGEGVVQLALAPDGKTVAVVRAYSDTTLFGTSGRTLFNLELFVFDVADPPKKPKAMWSARGLLSDSKTFGGPVSLAFSPDGKTLLAAFADPYYADKDAKSMGVKVWELVPKK